MKLTKEEEEIKRKVYKILKEVLQIVELNNNPIIDGKGYAAERIVKEVVQPERLSEEGTCKHCNGEGYLYFLDQGEPDLDSKCPHCK